MKILILEDDQNRIDIFKINLIGESVDYCIEAKEAIKLINAQKYDLIFLDHDLGGEIYVNSDDENTGYQVAKIIPNSINKDTKVIVHSFNPAGAKLMMQAIGRNAVRIPFCNIKFENTK